MRYFKILLCLIFSASLSAAETKNPAVETGQEKTTKAAETGQEKETKAPEKKESIKKKVPIRMSADTSSYDAKTGLITFRDNVVIEDVRFRLECAQMVIYYHKKTSEQKKKGEKAGIEKIVATKNVKIIQPDNQATADKAVYLFDEQTVTLTGSPIVKYKDGRELQATEIIYDRKNDTIRTGRIQINADQFLEEAESSKAP